MRRTERVIVVLSTLRVTFKKFQNTVQLQFTIHKVGTWWVYMVAIKYFMTIYMYEPNMRFPTMCYVRPAKAQTSLRIRAVWSEPLLIAWIFYDSSATDRTSLGVSMLIRRLHRLVWVYTRQNNTLLEITCRGSYIIVLMNIHSIRFHLRWNHILTVCNGHHNQTTTPGQNIDRIRVNVYGTYLGRPQQYNFVHR